MSLTVSCPSKWRTLGKIMLEKFHARNQSEIKQLTQRMPAVLIISGLSSLARKSAVSLLLGKRIDDPDSFFSVDSEKSTISINAVRGIYSRLHKKRSDQSPVFVLIKDAHRLTHPAQNALLKLMEETPYNTHIILTVAQADLLLPTVRSRAHKLQLLPLDEKTFADAMKESSASSLKLRHLCGGDPWLLIAEDGTRIEERLIKATVGILRSPLGSALVDSHQLVKDQQSFEQFLFVLARLARAGLKSSSYKDVAKAKQWQHRLETVVNIQDTFHASNINQKLLLDKLLLEFRSA